MIWQTGICLYSCFSLSAVIEGNTKCTTLADTTSQKTMCQGISIKPCWATHSSQNYYQIFPVERATSCLQHEQGLRSPLQPGLPGEMEILQWIRHAWSSLYSLKCLLQGVFSWSSLSRLCWFSFLPFSQLNFLNFLNFCSSLDEKPWSYTHQELKIQGAWMTNCTSIAQERLQ